MSRSRRHQIPRDPVERAYFYLGWEKRRGHLPCGVRSCADCAAAVARIDADYARLPLTLQSDPVEIQVEAMLRAFYRDPDGVGFDPVRVP